MSLKLASFAVATAAIGVIVLAAAAVFRKDASPPPAVVVAPPSYASPVEIDARPLADPSAQGVIAAQSQGRLFLLTPQGKPLAGPVPFTRRDGVSRDEAWLALTNCKEDGCSLFIGPNGKAWAPDGNAVQLKAAFLSGEWALETSLFAALDTAGNLYFVEPASRTPRLVKTAVTAYAWAAGDRLVFATSESGVARLWRASTSGAWTELARTKAPVTQLFPSADALTF
ncbi:MAG TPA: hypothetical protein VIB47_10855, partial [Dehalococcoidia bacterium]